MEEARERIREEKKRANQEANERSLKRIEEDKIMRLWQATTIQAGLRKFIDSIRKEMRPS